MFSRVVGFTVETYRNALHAWAWYTMRVLYIDIVLYCQTGIQALYRTSINKIILHTKIIYVESECSHTGFLIDIPDDKWHYYVH